MKNLFDLSGKVAIVTGAGSGLGRRFAQVLAAAGANLALVDRNDDGLVTTEALVEGDGIEVFSAKCDVSDRESVKKTVAEIKKQFGRIDILVNNAGVATVGASHEHDDDEWDKVINVNLNGVFFMSRAVGKIMVKQKYGKIVNMGSIHSNVAMSGLPITAYCTSKGGVLMMTKALAAEWARYGITVNAIGPSYFKSAMTKGVLGSKEFQRTLENMCPMGRVGEEGELDGALLYFASDASSFTTGQLLSVDGGWTAL
ncbi:MAG: SDR family oxidoreductase [Candidatus Nomurabacteria bacterium]|jgi:gluconate 5-dehydrogenase|nr:SDR family oxidoreductase [Candidatus Nomurabacteria bacterium]